MFWLKLDCNILLAIIIAMTYFEKEVATSLRNVNLEAFSREAAEIGVLPPEVEESISSLDPSVPHPTKLRYLLLHVHEYLQRCPDRCDSWLQLLAAHGVHVSSSVLQKVNHSSISASSFSPNLPCSTEGSQEIDSTGFRFLKDHVSVLMEILAEVSSSCHELGIALRLSRNLLREVERLSLLHGSKICLYRVLWEWVAGNCEHALAPTLENLKTALRSRTVGLGSEASELGDKLVEHGVLQDARARARAQLDPLEQPEVAASEVAPYREDLRVSIKSADIVSQSLNVSVVEEKSTLLEVRAVNTCGGTISYQWLKDDSPLTDDCVHYLGSDRSILCVKHTSLWSGGTYICQLKSSEQLVTISSKPIELTVTLPLFKRMLVDKYSSFLDVQKDSWPPIGCKPTFINLALIMQNKTNVDTDSCDTVRGHVDDVVFRKERVEYDEVFSTCRVGGLLLIEGRPGSGKTTLVHKVSKDWALGEDILAGAKLVFLISLRIFSGASLEDIFRMFYLDETTARDVLKKVVATNGDGTCFILDGLDEYFIEDKTQSIIHKLIQKEYLQRAMVIVSSRPSATAELRHNLAVKFDNVEVVGFLKEQIYEYIASHLPTTSHDHNSRVWELWGCLDQHPNVLHMCYLPVHATMISFLHSKLRGDLPHTESGIYTHFTMLTLLRKGRQASRHSSVRSLEDLSGDRKEILAAVCKLAFEMTTSHKQVFEEEKLPFREDDPSLGLVTIDHTAGLYDYSYNLYSFVHLTFHAGVSCSLPHFSAGS